MNFNPLTLILVLGLIAMTGVGCGGSSDDRPDLRVNPDTLTISPGQTGTISVGGGRIPYEITPSSDVSVAIASLNNDETVTVIAIAQGTAVFTIHDSDSQSHTVNVTVTGGPGAENQDDIDNDGDSYTENQGDCNDSDPGIHPGATETADDGTDQDCDGSDLVTDPNDTDDDGDGHTENQGDCNDSDPGVYPGATETADDGTDQDCDGSDLVTDPNNIDDDGDGHTENQGDCNDNDASVHPGATETADDGTDQDCDGSDLVTDPNTTDDDGDGYTENQGDCNDNDASVHPGAAEKPDDGTDQDCDGTDMITGSPNDRDDDGDHYTDNGGDCNDADSEVYPGATEICDDGKDNDCDGTADCDDADCFEKPPCRTCTDADSDEYYAESGCGTEPDCNDHNPGLHPGMYEICDDRKDNDCDGAVDCDDFDCIGSPECQSCTDADADNYYAEDNCGTEPDCNDNDETRYPGAVEICDDGKDNDCDGMSDCDDTDCFGYICNKIGIQSVEADRYVPFSPIDILVDGVDLFGKEKVYHIAFNDVKIAPEQIDYENGVISTFIPNMPGEVAIRITGEDNFASNSVSITVEEISLLPGVTAEGVVTATLGRLAEIAVTIQTEALADDISQEEKDALSELAGEISAVREVAAYFLEECTPEEREHFAALVANSGAVNSGETGTGRADFTPSESYENILSNRRIVERNNMLSAVLNFGKPGMLTALSSPIAAVLDTVNTAMHLEKVNFWASAALNDFTVEISEPEDGFYRDSNPPVTVFKGNFTGLMPKMEAFAETFTDLIQTVDELNAAKKQGLEERLAGMNDGFITNAFKEMLNSIADVEKAKIWYASMTERLKGRLVILEDVVFDISDFQKLTTYPKNDAQAKWEADTWQILFEKLGEVRMVFTLIDPLRSENDQRLIRELNFEVKNHLPEVTDNPACVVNADDGECAFTLKLSDQDSDDQGKLWAQVAEEGPVMFGNVEGGIGGFTYTYNETAPPGAKDITVVAQPGEQILITLQENSRESDRVLLKYGDPYMSPDDSDEYKTVTATIDLSLLSPHEVTYDIRHSPGKGQLDEITGNTVRYTADADAEGQDAFPYYAVKDGRYSEPATVTVIIQHCTDADSDSYYAENDCGTETDCNDNDAAVHPGIAEICDDDKDNDCDGAADCDDSKCADDAACISPER